MCNLHNQTLVYIATSNTAIRKSTATPIRATTSTNVERRHEKKAWQFRFFRIRFSVSFKTDFQFLSKSIFEMLLFPSFYAKKCFHGRFFCYVWHAINAEIWPSVTQTSVIYQTTSKDNIPVLPRSTKICSVLYLCLLFLLKSPVLKCLLSNITLLFIVVICKSSQWLIRPSLLRALCESSSIVCIVLMAIRIPSPGLYFTCHSSSGIRERYFFSFLSFLCFRYSLLIS